MKKLLISPYILVILLLPLVSASLMFSEDFNRASCAGDCWANDWNIIANSGSAEWAIINNTFGLFDDNSVGTGPDPRISRAIINVTGYDYYSIKYDTRFRPSESASGTLQNAPYLLFQNSTNGTIFQQGFTTYGDTGERYYLVLYNKTGLDTTFLKISLDWFNIEWVINIPEERLDLYINGVLNTSDIPLSNYNFNQLRWLSIGVPASGAGLMSDSYFDNISITSFHHLLNTTFYDEQTGLKIENVSWSLINDIQGSINGSNNITNQTILFNSPYIIEYSHEDYYSRRYYFNTSLNYENLELNLYLLNNSKTNNDLITYELQDEDGVPISGATLKVLRFYPEINQELIVEMSKSDDNGEGGLHLEKIDPQYRFVVEKDGVTLLDTSKAQIYTNTLLIRTALRENVIGSTVLVSGLDSDLTYNDSTGSFTLTWNDPTGTITSACLNVTKIQGTGITVINDSCLSASAGSITLGAEGNSTVGLYRAWSRIETNTQNSPHIIEFLEEIRTNILSTVGEEGTFYAVLLIITLALVGLVIIQHPAGVLFGALLGYISSALLGLFDTTVSAVIFAIVIIGLIIFGSRRGV